MRIRITDTDDKQGDTNKESAATEPKQPPRGTAVAVEADTPDGESL
jgi:hypothetical protein